MRGKAAAILGNAIIWGAVIIAVSLAIKGTEQAEQVRLILIGGAGGSLLVLGGTLGPKS